VLIDPTFVYHEKSCLHLRFGEIREIAGPPQRSSPVDFVTSLLSFPETPNVGGFH